METRWKSLSRHRACGIAGALILVCGLTGCATWRTAWRSVHPTDPLTPGEHLNLGVSYEHGGEWELALREFERAATGSTESLALTYQANIHLAMGDKNEAEKKYRAALKVDPDNVVALNNYAWYLALENRSLDEAERLIRHALERNPEPREAYEHTLNKILEVR